MNAAKTQMTPEEQLEDLTRRFQLLEGERKATYETAQLNIRQNKEIIKQMKVLNCFDSLIKYHYQHDHLCQQLTCNEASKPMVRTTLNPSRLHNYRMRARCFDSR